MDLNIKLFDEINNQKINYVVWKNTNLLENFYNGEENLDVYIENSSKKKFDNILKNNNCIKVISTTINHKDIDHYLYFFNEKILHIHAYFKLFTGSSISKDYDLTNYCNLFENKFFDKKYSLWIMDYKLQMTLYKIRLAIKSSTLLGRHMINRDIINYRKEYESIDINLNKNKLSTISNNNFFEVKLDIKNLTFSNVDIKNILKHVSPYRTKTFFKTKVDEIIFLHKVIFKRIFKLKKFKLRNKIIIFISGPDASGKSTIAHQLKNIFDSYLNTKIYNIAKPYPGRLINGFIKKKIFY
jgi:Predicted kinase